MFNGPCHGIVRQALRAKTSDYLRLSYMAPEGLVLGDIRRARQRVRNRPLPRTSSQDPCHESISIPGPGRTPSGQGAKTGVRVTV